MFHAVDVAEQAEVERLVAATVDRFGRLDVLVNNAGIGSFGETPDVDPAEWHRVIAVDLHSVFYGCRAAQVGDGRAGGGAIVNTASISGLGGDYGFAAYNAAKGAVVNYTRALAIDHAHEGIRANCVCPGPIETPLLTSWLLTDPEAKALRLARNPTGRFGRPEDIVYLALYLASDDSSWTNGAIISADGGITANYF